jgi:hypothetical protein
VTDPLGERGQIGLGDWPGRQERRRGVAASFGGSRLEDTVGHACVEMHVVVERRAEAVAGEMPPSRELAALGISASGVSPDAASRRRSISVRKIFVSTVTARSRSASMPRSRFADAGETRIVPHARHYLHQPCPRTGAGRAVLDHTLRPTGAGEEHGPGMT